MDACSSSPKQPTAWSADKMSGSERKRLVMWRRLMLMHAAARGQKGSVTDADAQKRPREIPEPVATHDSSRTA